MILARPRLAVCCVGALALALSVAARAGAPGRTEWTAEKLLPLADAHGGSVAVVQPPEDRLKLATGKLLVFKPAIGSEVLSLRVPVPKDGCYRITTRLVFGPWRDGRYGMYRAKADGVTLEGYYHGWYGRGTTPAYRMRTKDWGTAFLRAPFVELSFHLEPKQAGDLLAIETLALKPVADDPKAPRVPERPAPPPDARWPACEIDGAQPLDWVLPVPWDNRKFRPDGDLADWSQVGMPHVIDAKTIVGRGYGAPPPESNRDLSVTAGLTWDATGLRIAASMWDDELAATKPGGKWASFWSHDGLVVLLHEGEGKELTVGLNYYSPGSRPRPLPGGVAYAAKPREGGYDLEAVVPFAAFRHTARPGDRLRMMLIAVDIDPSQPGGRRFQQYLWHTRMGDSLRWGEIRLVGPEGCGGDLTLEHGRHVPGQRLRYLGLVDVFARAERTLDAIEVVDAATGAVASRVAVGLKLPAERRIRLRGELDLPQLPAGRYELRPVLK